MAYRLLFHDLITLPTGGNRTGIFWLRLYQTPDGTAVVVVTEVPGNPGMSVANCISTIGQYVVDRFALDPSKVTLFQIFPTGALRTGLDVHAVRLTASSPEWRDVSRHDIEALLRTALPALPDHEELYGRVVALGGGVTQTIWRPVFRAVAVVDLPVPHGPFRCRYGDRYKQIAVQVARRHSSMDPEGRELEAGQRFLDSLSPRDTAACSFHKADWRAISNESVRILETVGDDAWPDDYLVVAAESRLRRREKAWLQSLFSDPIFIGGGTYTNGQHRGCALRFSGAERAAIHVDDEELGEESVDWVYGGDG